METRVQAGIYDIARTDSAIKRGRRAGDEAATECWHRWNDAGREVQAYTTDRPGTDIADVIKGAHHE